MQIISGGYHGRTMGAASITRSKTGYFEGTLPLMPGSYATPFPYWHQHNLPPSTSTDTLVANSLYQLDLLLKQQCAPRDTAAIIIEPVIGEGGYIPAPPAYLEGLRKICDKHGILLIIDEVQSGYGRTGKMFAIEHSGVKPDILLVAKGLANGFPLSAVISRKELTDKLIPGSMVGSHVAS
jgi:4-aminobutyrate aminotransferase